MPKSDNSREIRLSHADLPMAEEADVVAIKEIPPSSAAKTPPSTRGTQTPKQPFQFTLGRVQWLILIACIASAGMGALLRIDTSDAGFITISLALLILPSGLLIAIGFARGGYELYKNWQADRKLWKPAKPPDVGSAQKPDPESTAKTEE